MIRLRRNPTTPRKRRPNTTAHEHAEQCVVVAWSRMNAARWPELRWLYAVPNGGKRSIGVARKMKAEGAQRGVPDLVLPVPRNGHHSLYLELKRRAGGRLSPEQREWTEYLAAAGFRVVVAAGADEAIAVLRDYLEGGEQCEKAS